jgi:hypothetical protein
VFVKVLLGLFLGKGKFSLYLRKDGLLPQDILFYFCSFIIIFPVIGLLENTFTDIADTAIKIFNS